MREIRNEFIRYVVEWLIGVILGLLFQIWSLVLIGIVFNYRGNLIKSIYLQFSALIGFFVIHQFAITDGGSYYPTYVFIIGIIIFVIQIVIIGLFLVYTKSSDLSALSTKKKTIKQKDSQIKNVFVWGLLPIIGPLVVVLKHNNKSNFNLRRSLNLVYAINLLVFFIVFGVYRGVENEINGFDPDLDFEDELNIQTEQQERLNNIDFVE